MSETLRESTVDAGFGRRMQKLNAVLRAASRWVNWHYIGIALSIVIITIAGVTLFRILRGVDFLKIVDAIRDTPTANIATAAAFVAAAYVSMTFYDLFALRTIGRPNVPYRVAAMAAFCSYSIGHNIGATVFTGGAIRFRIYSAWKLSVVDVAKMAFITGLTFWLGNLTVLGLGMSYEPEAATLINHVPASFNRLIALAMLVVIAGYVVWIGTRPRVIGRQNWRVVLPGARLTLVQIGIGILDLTLSGFAMFMLTPAIAGTDFVSVLVPFVLSTLLAFASHAPGGLGVLDASMLVGLPQFAPEQLLAALLLFRLLYYIVPFILAVSLMGTREIFMSLTARAALCKKACAETSEPPCKDGASTQSPE